MGVVVTFLRLLDGKGCLVPIAHASTRFRITLEYAKFEAAVLYRLRQHDLIMPLLGSPNIDSILEECSTCERVRTRDGGDATYGRHLHHYFNIKSTLSLLCTSAHKNSNVLVYICSPMHCNPKSDSPTRLTGGKLL